MTTSLQHYFEGDALDRDGLNAIIDDLTYNDANEVPVVMINRITKRSFKSAAGTKLKIQGEVLSAGPYTTLLGYVDYKITFPEPFGSAPAVTFSPIGREAFMVVINGLTNTYFQFRVQQNPSAKGDSIVNITAVSYVAVGAA